MANDFDLDDPASPPITVPAPPTVNLPSLTSDKGGTLVNNGDGTVDYTSVGLTAPDTDTFLYSITDASGKTSDFATVTVSLTAFVNEHFVVQSWLERKYMSFRLVDDPQPKQCRH